LKSIVHGAIAFFSLVQEKRKLAELIEQQDEQLKYFNQNFENKKIEEKATHIRTRFLSSIESLVNALEVKNEYTEGHSHRVSMIAASVDETLSLEKEEIERTRLAGLLHDVGKVGIRDLILQMPDKLYPDETNHMKTHSEIIEYILNPIFDDKEVIKVIRHHHEHYDGNGYPNGIMGKEIPIGARILSVADTYDALTFAKPYRKARHPKRAIEEIIRCSGTQFDPAVVNAFLKMIERW
jgi:HD-GYP domain-containing protein (c-di-GMP phosphodiesterase class II)